MKFIYALFLSLALVGCSTAPLTDAEATLIRETAIQYAVMKVSVENKEAVSVYLREVKEVLGSASESKSEMILKVSAKVDSMDLAPEDKMAVKTFAMIALGRTEIPEVPYQEQAIANIDFILGQIQ